MLQYFSVRALFVLQSFNNPLQLIKCDFSIDISVIVAKELLHMIQIHVDIIILQKFEQILDIDPSPRTIVQAVHHSLYRIVVVAHKFPPEGDQSRLFFHYFDCQIFENIHLSADTLREVFECVDWARLHPYRNNISQLLILSGQNVVQKF